MEPKESGNPFDFISDDVLLKILKNVPRRYWYNVSRVCTRFQNVCRDKEIFKSSNLSCEYGMSEMHVKEYLHTGMDYIVCLNLNHCHWLSSSILAASISRCKKVQHLYLLDSRLTVKGLSRVICSLDCLKTLVISVSDLLEFSNEINTNQQVQHSLRHLQHFGLHICEESKSHVPNSLQFHLSQQTTLIEYCPNLESLCVTGQPAAVQKLLSSSFSRLIHPLIVRVENMSKLTTMEINNTNDATARLYFFGMLVKAFEAGVKFRNLSVSGLDLNQAVKRSYFIRALKESCSTLENLDLSRSHIDELKGSITIEDAPCMKYLNLSDIQTKSTVISLIKMASQCSNLVSLNLKGATSGLRHRYWTSVELGELDHVLQNCRHLAHLNLSGIHIHCEDLEHTLLDILIKHRLKALRSLALPLCCLVELKTSSTTKTNFISHGLGKRQRVARQPVASTSSGDGSRQPQAEVCDVSLLAQAYPLLESLEMINSSFFYSAVFNSQAAVTLHRKEPVYTPCSLSMKLRDHHLEPLNLLKNLRYLQLTGLPGCSLMPLLRNISTSCVHIERLCLTHIGGGSVPPLAWEYLQNLRSLTDLRIEQPGLKLDDRLFGCLARCPVERLVLVSNNSRLVDLSAVEQYVQEARSLYLIQIFTSDSTFKDCDKLQSMLQKRFEVERPGFIATVDTLHRERVTKVIGKLPLHHLEEMTILSSKVSTKLSHKLGQPFLS